MDDACKEQKRGQFNGMQGVSPALGHMVSCTPCSSPGVGSQSRTILNECQFAVNVVGISEIKNEGKIPHGPPSSPRKLIKCILFIHSR